MRCDGQGVTYFDMSMTGVRAFGVGNFASVFSSCLWTVTVQDLQDASWVGGFNVILVRSPDGFVILLPGDVGPLASGVLALEPQRFAKFMGDVFQLLDKTHGFWEEQRWNQSFIGVIYFRHAEVGNTMCPAVVVFLAPRNPLRCSCFGRKAMWTRTVVSRGIRCLFSCVGRNTMWTAVVVAAGVRHVTCNGGKAMRVAVVVNCSA